MVEPTMTAEERAMVDKLRDIVKQDLTPYYDTDFNLLRWMQGYNSNLDAIVPKLRNHLRFRKTCWDLDNMHKLPRNHPIQQHWQSGLTGLSGKIENAIVNVEQTGPNDYWGMLHTHSASEVMKSRIQDLEIMFAEVLKQEKKSGKLPTCYSIELFEVEACWQR